MKRNTILYSFVLACSLFFMGCNEETLPSDNGITIKEGMTQLTLVPDFNRVVTVKSVTNANETVISNVWVIQLDDSGNVLQGENAPLYEGNVTDAGNNQYTIDVRLSTEAQEILFIANTGLNSLFTNVSNKEDIKTKSLSTSSEATLAPSTGMIMCGTWKAGQESYNIKMERAIAKVEFTLEANTNFVLQSIQVKNIPNKLYYFREDLEADGNAIAYYPATSDIENLPETAYSIERPEDSQNISTIWNDLQWMPDGNNHTGILLNQAQTFTWYLPENGRGIGTATNQRDKNATTAAEGQGEYCTYIQVKGFYRTEDLATGVTYNIYLGENNYNNYNIIRNTNYKVSTTILGIDRTDTRISKEEDEEITPINYLDYTDNGSPWFVIAAKNNGSTNWENLTPPAGTEWVVPTQKEMMLAWIYEAKDNPNPFGPIICWLNERTETSRWSINMEIGEVVLSTGGQNSYVLQTIKQPENSTFLKYPYVQGGKGNSNIIVSRDASGGVRADYVRTTPWTVTPQHDERDPNNIVAAKFEVAPLPPEGSPQRIRRTWDEAATYCASLNETDNKGWRMPTQRELMLMFVMNDQLKEPLLNQSLVEGTTGEDEVIHHAFYWSATEDRTQEAQESQTGWSVCFCRDNPDDPTGKTEGYPKEYENYIRCVRDVLDNE